ncbi:MAG: 6,7-dimethyl-8-ribityllumazine synthase [Candidatus Obscuribacterales bacterium]|nr:6,7-dimethyl-8-ribityllumazine synthase [Steroidobacteraceae bacterium]
MQTLEGDLQVRDLRFAIVAARFNAIVVDRLLDGAIEALKRHGASDAGIVVARVPGAFDLPVVAKKLADSGRFHAVIALGAVIRGDTAHFDYVAGECASGLTQASLASGVPIAFGVLTTDNVEQAMQRAGEQIATTPGGAKPQADVHVDTLTGNKGADAALCAIEMANLLRAIERSK